MRVRHGAQNLRHGVHNQVMAFFWRRIATVPTSGTSDPRLSLAAQRGRAIQRQRIRPDAGVNGADLICRHTFADQVFAHIFADRHHMVRATPNR